MAGQKVRHVIPKKHLYRAAFNRETWVQCYHSYERIMGIAYGCTLIPVIDDLYRDDPDGAAKRKEVIEREVELSDVHIELGSCIPGMAIALEEQKPLGESTPDEFITSLETSLMGSLTDIEDTIYQGILIPILLAIYIDTTLTGTVWGAIVYLILMLAINHIFNFANLFSGCQQGPETIMGFLEKDLLDELLPGAQVIGYMVMGGLIASYVKVSCGLELIISRSKFNIQAQLFNTVMPGILSPGFAMLVYWLMRKRWTSIKIIILVIIISIIGGLAGILTQQST